MRALCLTVALLCSSFVQAQELVEITVEATAKESNEPVVAKEKILRTATDQAVEKFVRDMIGDAKFDRNRAVISQRIFRQSDRFIPFVRTSEPVKAAEDGTWSGSVTLKLSLKSLRDLLNKEGLLYLTEGVPSILPLVEGQDRVRATSYRWWATDLTAGSQDPQLKELTAKFIAALREEFGHKGFYLIDPVSMGYRELLPDAYRSDTFRTEDLQFIGEFLQATVVLRGKINLDREAGTGRGSVIRVGLEALHTGNARVVAEANRVFEVKSGALDWALQTNFSNMVAETTKDLGQQLFDVWQKGTLGAVPVRVTIQGEVTFQEVENFKRDLLKISEIKKAVEREFAQDSVSFQLDVSGGQGTLADKLAGSGGLKMQVVENSPARITLKKR